MFGSGLYPVSIEDRVKRIYIAHTLRLMEYVEKEVFPLLDAYARVDPFRVRRKEYAKRDEDDIREVIQKTQTPSWPIVHDKALIDTCDFLLMINSDGPSYGSILELGYAHDVCKIPCIAVVTEEYLTHPWLNDYCITVTDDINIAMLSLHRYYGTGEYGK